MMLCVSAKFLVKDLIQLLTILVQDMRSLGNSRSVDQILPSLLLSKFRATTGTFILFRIFVSILSEWDEQVRLPLVW